MCFSFCKGGWQKKTGAYFHWIEFCLLNLLIIVHKINLFNFVKFQTIFDIVFRILLWCIFSFSIADNVNCETPHLRISPSQAPLRLPVGKSQVITCQGKVENSDLISDLQWTNGEGLQIQPKTWVNVLNCMFRIIRKTNIYQKCNNFKSNGRIHISNFYSIYKYN